MTIIAIVLAAAGLASLILGVLQKRSRAASDARSEPQAGSGAGRLVQVGGVLLAAAVVVGVAGLFMGGHASPVCAKAITCCKVAANGQHLEVCDNLASVKEEDCRASLENFRKVIEQIRPAQLSQCD